MALPPKDSVENRIKAQFGKPHVFFPHRLDKHTSGLMVVGFDAEIVRDLAASVRKRQWAKRYRAVVQLPPCATQATLAQMRGNAASANSVADNAAAVAGAAASDSVAGAAVAKATPQHNLSALTSPFLQVDTLHVRRLSLPLHVESGLAADARADADRRMCVELLPPTRHAVY
jgi:hypothetical protein